VSTPPGPARATGSYFDAVGGEETFRRLVARFYEGVAQDPLLRPLYPEEDLGPAEERLRLFLIQYWGGPGTYSERRGHPRLRMRHAPFPVGPEQIEAWLGHMLASLDELALPPELDTPLRSYLVTAAHSLQNTR
jgi:hemoglobin